MILSPTKNNSFTNNSLIKIILLIYLTPLLSTAKLNIKPEKINFHKINTKGKKVLEVNIQNNSNIHIQLKQILTFCNCITIEFVDKKLTLPIKIEKNIQIKLKITLNPETYSGNFRKNIIFRYSNDNSLNIKLLTLPVLAFIENDQDISSYIDDNIKKNEQNKINNKKLAIQKYNSKNAVENNKNSLILFLSDECSSCEWVKKQWLPTVMEDFPQLQIFRIDVETKKGILLLVDFEERYNGDNTKNIPVVYYQNKLYYGTKEIENVFK